MPERLRLEVEVTELGFRGGPVLDVSLAPSCVQLEEGSIALLVGKNGSGKSSLLRLVSGVSSEYQVPPDWFTGRIEAWIDTCRVPIVPRLVSRSKKEELSVGYLAQAPRANITAGTVRAEIRRALQSVCASRNELSRRLEAAEERLALRGVRGQDNPANLSRGQQQLVGLEAVISAEPRMLVLDEPTAALDNKAARMLCDRLLAGAADCQSRIVLIATHDERTIRWLEERVPLTRVEVQGTLRGRERETSLWSKSAPPEWMPAEEGTIGRGNIRAESLGIRRGALRWQGAEITVGQGELALVRGPNGSGKSTLLDILAGHNRKARGLVAIGPRWWRANRIRYPPEVAYAPQNAEDCLLFTAITAELRTPPKRCGWWAAARDVLSELGADLRSHPWKLSFGQRKVLLYLVQVFASHLLLADEPLASLDPGLRERLRRLLTSYCEAGGSVVMTSSQDGSEMSGVACPTVRWNMLPDGPSLDGRHESPSG